jgi:D-alanine-D-alanine ligase
MRVTVLMGGVSDEREVSLASGCQVADALRQAGHEVVAVDTVHGPLTRDEEARLLATGVGTRPPTVPSGLTEPTGLVQLEAIAEADVVFPALHGGQGEDGTVQALLDLAGVPYAGSGVLGCSLAMDKDVTKRLLRDAGVRTADWRAGELRSEDILGALSLPLIVKPVAGGSSVHLYLVETEEELGEALAKVSGEVLMAEAFLSGREFTVGVLGEETFPVGEIVPQHRLFDYECKYQPGMAQEIFPADIPESLSEQLRETALTVHRLLRLRDFSRVDFIVDEWGVAWCLEANALPGLTANSLLPKAALAGGVSFPELCDRIVRLAFGDRRRSRG